VEASTPARRFTCMGCQEAQRLTYELNLYVVFHVRRILRDEALVERRVTRPIVSR